jgi:hypothetical protein
MPVCAPLLSPPFHPHSSVSDLFARCSWVFSFQPVLPPVSRPLSPSPTGKLGHRRPPPFLAMPCGGHCQGKRISIRHLYALQLSCSSALANTRKCRTAGGPSSVFLSGSRTVVGTTIRFRAVLEFTRLGCFGGPDTPNLLRMFLRFIHNLRLANCAICGEPMELETTKTDEDGKAVHEDCYAARMRLRQITPPPKAS